jgi:[Skp1-protein]-hydroxyproline N-acetylglucosaminyltransferase
MASFSKLQLLLCLGGVLIFVWIYLFWSLMGTHEDHDQRNPLMPKYEAHSAFPAEVFIDSHKEPPGKPRKIVPSKKIEVHSLLNDKQSVSRAYENNNQYFLSEPPPLSEVAQNMTLYLRTIHKALGDLAGPTVSAPVVWDTFLNVTRAMPMTWDEMNKHRFPKPRKDESIFVSVGTYRDPFCPMTMKNLYGGASRPERVFVSMFQQNCFGPKCRTGVLVGGRVEEAGPDLDCYKEFCASAEAERTQACVRGQVRLFNVNESESLGPYMARYLGAKFYRGEQYYLQIDSHSEFVSDWDNKLIDMMKAAPAEKPVISTYPPDSTQNWKNTVGFRMCDSEFASAQIEWQIIRLGSSMAFDHSIPKIPPYAPFVAAGFFFTYGDFLYEVGFDPFLPWIFMGEEISLSARLWTSGYDIFSPTINVLNHYYVRRHYPKFWESVNR